MTQQGLNPLAQLIRDHCERTGETLKQVGDRGGLSRQTLSSLVNANGQMQLPRTTTLVKLADGLGLPFETVRRVAAEAALGEDVDSDRRSVRMLTAHAERLSDGAIAVLLATARALELQDDTATRQGPLDGTTSHSAVSALR